jgi:hypothetical protein
VGGWEAEIRRIMVQGQPEQKFHKNTSQPVAEHGGEHLSPQLLWKHKKVDHGPDQPRQKARPYLKNNQSKKRAGSMAQTVECLPSKHEALSSNSSTTKKKAQKNKKRIEDSLQGIPVV